MKIDHIGIAVKSLELTTKAYESLGLEVTSTDSVWSEGVKVAFLPAGDTKIELLEPLNADSVIARFIEKRGEGVHHLALQVDDIEAAMKSATEHGMQLINEEPKIGAHGRKVAFIHPKSTGGVLIELVQVTS